jgi:hypothetical protein
MLLAYSSAILPIYRTGDTILAKYVLNFEKFDKPKTLVNVSDWIFVSVECAKLKHADVNQFAAHGASNAIGSVSEYESLLQTARPNEVHFDVCYAHRINALVGMLQATSNLLNKSTQHSGKF